MESGSRTLGILAGILFLGCTCVMAQDMHIALKDLIDEAMKNNPEILSAEAKAASASTRISQQASLPDPMLSVGYQNEGLSRYEYGDSPDAQWMFSVSQSFAYPGKLSLQQEAAMLEAQAEKANAQSVRQRVKSSITQAYYELFLAIKEIDLIQVRKPIAEQFEEAALARYSSGTGQQTDVIMAQAEKYMLIEKELMAKQKKESIEAMLSRELGRSTASPIGTPLETQPTRFDYKLEELLEKTNTNSPELSMQQSLMQASEKRFLRSKKEAWPDVTVMAKYSNRGGGMKDMYELAASVPLPLFYKSKQGPGMAEASWNLTMAKRDLEASRVKIAGELRDNLAMVKATEHIMELYKNALIPKARQDVDAAFAQYRAGRMDTVSALAKLKVPFDYELTLWQQYAEHEKAIARINALIGDMEDK